MPPAEHSEERDRRDRLRDSIGESKDLDGTLSGIIAEGFAPAFVKPLLRQFAVDDAMLCLKSHWLNAGVRVNIAPLRRAGILAADVPAAKDVEKAIADRATWRDDERRWCREGKLPKPGWWE